MKRTIILFSLLFVFVAVPSISTQATIGSCYIPPEFLYAYQYGHTLDFKSDSDDEDDDVVGTESMHTMQRDNMLSMEKGENNENEKK